MQWTQFVGLIRIHHYNGYKYVFFNTIYLYTYNIIHLYIIIILYSNTIIIINSCLLTFIKSLRANCGHPPQETSLDDPFPLYDMYVNIQSEQNISAITLKIYTIYDLFFNKIYLYKITHYYQKCSVKCILKYKYVFGNIIGILLNTWKCVSTEFVMASIIVL